MNVLLIIIIQGLYNIEQWRTNICYLSFYIFWKLIENDLSIPRL